MITLCLDTSYNALVIALYEEEKLIDFVEEWSPRQQSERIFPELDALVRKHAISPSDIGQIVIASGPGSYTGVRIAMTIAKVMASLKSIPLYTISTLALYQVGDVALIDAKGGNVFFREIKDEIISVEEAIHRCAQKTVSGDAHLVQKQPLPLNIHQQFILKKHLWQLVEDVDCLTPTYLKGDF